MALFRQDCPLSRRHPRSCPHKQPPDILNPSGCFLWATCIAYVGHLLSFPLANWPPLSPSADSIITVSSTATVRPSTGPSGGMSRYHPVREDAFTRPLRARFLASIVKISGNAPSLTNTSFLWPSEDLPPDSCISLFTPEPSWSFSGSTASSLIRLSTRYGGQYARYGRKQRRRWSDPRSPGATER